MKKIEITDIYISNKLFIYLNNEKIAYDAFTYYTGKMVYRIYTEDEEHLKKIDKIVNDND